MRFRRRSLPGLEAILLDCTGHAFPKHSHDEFVVSVNLTGRESIWLDGRTYQAGPGEVTLYNPGQTQAGDGGRRPWSCASLHIDSGALGRWLDLPPDTVFANPVLPAGVTTGVVRRVVAKGLDPVVPADEVIEAATVMAGDLLDAAGSRRRPAGTASAGAALRVAERLRAAIADPPSLEHLAVTEGLTPVQLVRSFARVHGLPPFAWLNVQRLKAARERLGRGARPAAVAAELGFADQAHLTRRFKAMYGVPPGVWQAGVSKAGIWQAGA